MVILVSVTCSLITMIAYHIYLSERAIVMYIAGFINSQKDGYMTGKISSGKLVENINSLILGHKFLQKKRAISSIVLGTVNSE